MTCYTVHTRRSAGPLRLPQAAGYRLPRPGRARGDQDGTGAAFDDRHLAAAAPGLPTTLRFSAPEGWRPGMAMTPVQPATRQTGRTIRSPWQARSAAAAHVDEHHRPTAGVHARRLDQRSGPMLRMTPRRMPQCAAADRARPVAGRVDGRHRRRPDGRGRRQLRRRQPARRQPPAAAGNPGAAGSARRGRHGGARPAPRRLLGRGAEPASGTATTRNVAGNPYADDHAGRCRRPPWPAGRLRYSRDASRTTPSTTTRSASASSSTAARSRC